jgi:hypothetical protein
VWNIRQQSTLPTTWHQRSPRRLSDSELWNLSIMHASCIQILMAGWGVLSGYLSLEPSWVAAWRKTPHNLSLESIESIIITWRRNQHLNFVSYSMLNPAGGGGAPATYIVPPSSSPSKRNYPSPASLILLYTPEVPPYCPVIGPLNSLFISGRFCHSIDKPEAVVWW